MDHNYAIDDGAVGTRWQGLAAAKPIFDKFAIKYSNGPVTYKLVLFISHLLLQETELKLRQEKLVSVGQHPDTEVMVTVMLDTEAMGKPNF